MAEAALAPKSTLASKGLWLLLALVPVAIAGAFIYRYEVHRNRLLAAIAAGRAAIALDTYGGYRDADRALREFVGPHSDRPDLIALRSYALAQLAARYGDDQAAIDSELLNAPLERGLQEDPSRHVDLPGRFFAARALLLLANGEPGSALLTLSGSPPGADSPELQVVRAEVLRGLEKPQEAKVALQQALAHRPPSLEALRVAALQAVAAQEEPQAAALARQALAVNPEHWPSLLLLGDLALRGKGVGLDEAREPLERAMRGLAEASPAEQCQALYQLAQIDLLQGNIEGVFQTLNRGADIDETPSSCRSDLARLNLRLGRQAQALALLDSAASEDDPGEAPLAYAEALSDPARMLEQANKPMPSDLSGRASARWQARVDAIKLTSALALGQKKLATPLAKRLEGWDLPQVECALAAFRAAMNDQRGAAKLLDQAQADAAKLPEAGDALARVGEQALALQLWPQAAASCGEASRRVPANYRALICQGRALAKLKRLPEASAAADRAAALNPTAPEATALRAQLAAAPLTP